MTPLNQYRSPLRYPGGKGKLANFLAYLIRANHLDECSYVEPYAGGAGAAVKLFLAGHVKRLILNDADNSIYSFWWAIKNKPDQFIKLIERTPVDIENWRRQKNVYQNPKNHSPVETGFSTFFLNRTNRSGIIANGGVIGGREQKGQWKIDARFNKLKLVNLISSLASRADDFEIHNKDAIDFISCCMKSAKVKGSLFLYLDPPYFNKADKLYMNYYGAKDHLELSLFLQKLTKMNWILTYDNVPEIRKLYAWANTRKYSLNYSASKSRTGTELMIYNSNLKLPYDIGELLS